MTKESPSLLFIQRKWKFMFTQKYIYINIFNSFIWYDPKLEITQMPVDHI